MIEKQTKETAPPIEEPTPQGGSSPSFEALGASVSHGQDLPQDETNSQSHLCEEAEPVEVSALSAQEAQESVTPTPLLKSPFPPHQTLREPEVQGEETEYQGVLGLIEMILKDRPKLFSTLESPQTLSQTLPGLLVITLLCCVVVGGILGSYTGGWQILYVAFKLPLLLLLTLAVCHGCFWVWGLYFRVGMGGSQIAGLTLSSIATTSLLLLGLCPLLWLAFGGGISAITKLSLSAQEAHYHRAILALILVFGIAGVGGIHVLYQGLQRMGTQLNIPQRWGGKTLMATMWIGMYGLVGLQVAWLMRPYLFHPWANGRPLTFVRSLEGNVYEAIIKTLIRVLGLH